MEKSVQITMVIVGAVLLLALIGVFSYGYFAGDKKTVSSDGVSQISAMPDLVTIYFNVETKGTDAKEAKDKNSEIVEKVITALILQGFERKEIQTENFNVYPDYTWVNGRQNANGYRATHSLKIELSTEDSSKLSKIIDAVVDNGASLSYINFELSLDKQKELKTQALAQASEDARLKADAIASGLGMRVGKLVSVSTSDFGYQPWRVYDAVAGASSAEMKLAATNIQPSEQQINANVHAVFELR
jgi:hypothetical protein